MYPLLYSGRKLATHKNPKRSLKIKGCLDLLLLKFTIWGIIKTVSAWRNYKLRNIRVCEGGACQGITEYLNI